MKTLLIDNYDSYTYNLFQLISEVNGEEPVVVRNDDGDGALPRLAEFDNVVVSPGPGHPGNGRDFGVSARVIAEATVPVLGVCLGHQGIALGERARVAPAPQPRHGHLSRVRHDGRDLFEGLTQDFTAVRYHSLAVHEPLPAALEATAWAEDGVLMGLRHRERPLWGVQFHPESVLTEYGHRMLVNFRNLTARRARRARTKNTAVPPTEAAIPRPRSASGAQSTRGAVGAQSTAGAAGPAGVTGGADEAGFPAALPRARHTARTAAPRPGAALPRPRQGDVPAYRLHTRRLAGAVDTEAAYGRLFAASARSFWLDSSLVEQSRSRFSFLGDDSGPLAEFVRYDVTAGRCEVIRAGRPPRKVSASVFDYLKRQLTSRRVDADGLPFDFTGGYVGYFGYETKADCGSPNRHRAETPDACWLFADRLLAVDHEEDVTYAVCLAEDTPQAAAEAEEWLTDTLAQLSFLAPGDRRPAPPAAGAPDPEAAEPWLVRDRATYLADIEACQRELRAGTSYEVCLTNAARLPAPSDPYAFYRELRRVNPAPYAALLRFGDLDVAGSSPERFLRITRDGVAEAKPIKGTAPRGATPFEDGRLRDALAADAKTRAENLMIVDLLRNDLGRVCRTGTVRVPRLMATESYATVHQLVSTVTGRLRAGTDAVDCVRACFPGGSMTGAPKLRTLEIIDSLETEARGVYSGALGYLGCSGGADLGIVIRTAVMTGGRMQLGAGGAIVLDSDPAAEYDEMLLKTAAQMRALRAHSASAADAVQEAAR
ncbi:aminodeoxychorismate synthase component I [Streptomyces arenae]|uniref:aminodeoxychorismate synthase component I n=1 Tax=Streptomyces arenae TaxID=29301 RepID=UPI00265919E7|nr:aminodeoxychorismate synthase component I [Streptomyces arenae]MCG7208600.1 aminodeoxychorismate synthase component I [Streptomyces arenae]